jgi:hypothetical protein
MIDEMEEEFWKEVEKISEKFKIDVDDVSALYNLEATLEDIEHTSRSPNLPTMLMAPLVRLTNFMLESGGAPQIIDKSHGQKRVIANRCTYFLFSQDYLRERDEVNNALLICLDPVAKKVKLGLVDKFGDRKLRDYCPKPFCEGCTINNYQISNIRRISKEELVNWCRKKVSEKMPRYNEVALEVRKRLLPISEKMVNKSKEIDEWERAFESKKPTYVS